MVGGTLIDGTGQDPLPEAVVVIGESVIQEVGRKGEVEIPADCEVIDVSGKTVMPGMFDCHCHVSLTTMSIEKRLFTPKTVEVFQTAEIMKRTLHAGFTTIREPGILNDVGFRQAVEMGLMNAAASQMAQFYDLPLYSTAGMSDSKVIDAQSGYESAITNLMVALAGGGIIHDAAGFLEFCMTASYDKIVIDDEIIGMVMRAVEGIRVDDETLAFDLIQKAGPGGHFVSSRHTRRHMRSEQYLPKLSDRNDRVTWEAAGAKDSRMRAAERVREIFSEPARSVIPEEARKRIRERIPGLRHSIMC